MRKPHDYGEPWDRSDTLELRRLKRLGSLTWQQIAERLGRTEAGCRSRWYRLAVAAKRKRASKRYTTT